MDDTVAPFPPISHPPNTKHAHKTLEKISKVLNQNNKHN